MRKVAITLIMIVSVLCLWGQKPVEFTYKRAQSTISELKNLQDSVLIRMQDSKSIPDSVRNNARIVLTETFQNLDSVMSVYKQIEEDSTLKVKATTIIVEFINKYSNAIFDDDKQYVQISTAKFIDVAKYYSPKFKDFYEGAKEYIDSKANGGALSGNGLDAAGDSTENKDDDSSLYVILIWIAIVLGVISACTSAFAIVAIRKMKDTCKKKDENINKWKDQIGNTINERIDQIDKKIDKKNQQICGNNNKKGGRGFYTTKSNQNGFYETLPNNEGRNKAGTSSNVSHADILKKQEETVNNNVVGKQTNETYLYATVNVSNVQRGYPEFFKVSDSNSGDKVFRLTINNPADEEAEFTIIPDMSQDFMKSVINQRDTYLPTIFCERTINSANPEKINVISVGRARKEGDIWKVEDRMKISLD